MEDETTAVLDEDEGTHLVKVLRHQTGDEVHFTNGEGKLYRAELLNGKGKSVKLKLVQLEREEQRAVPHVHIAIAPTKSMERFEWFLEKATELGINEITPLICQRSERDKIRPERLNKILISAMKQSLRLWLPKLNPMIKLRSWVAASTGSQQQFIAHCQSKNLPSLKALLRPQQSITILVGPEGDFTLDEITLAVERGITPVSLGEARLRTETAGMVAVHTVRMINE